MTDINEMRLQLLLQQEQQRIVDSNNDEIELPVVQARGLCWLVLLAEAHEDQANDAEKRGDSEQAMGWYADAQRLRDVINVVTKIDIPYLEEEQSLSENTNDMKLTIPISELNTNLKIDDVDNFANNARENLRDISSDQIKENKIYEKFEVIAKSLENHCEIISKLLKTHDEKLFEQEKMHAKISEKIKFFESKNIYKSNLQNPNFKRQFHQSMVPSTCKDREKSERFMAHKKNNDKVFNRK